MSTDERNESWAFVGVLLLVSAGVCIVGALTALGTQEVTFDGPDRLSDAFWVLGTLGVVLAVNGFACRRHARAPEPVESRSHWE